MRAAVLALILLPACATTKKVDRAADGVADVSASIKRVVDEIAPPASAASTAPAPPVARPSSPLDALLASTPALVVNGAAFWRAAVQAWHNYKAAKAAEVPGK